MIVRPAAGALHLITQPDHAGLSRRIMARWRPLAGAPRRDAILLAIGEHDNGWREADRAPRVDADGRIVDFVKAPAEIKQPVWPRGVARLTEYPWAAALVAQHAIAVHDRFHGDPAWTAFFAGMEAERDRFVRAAGHTLDELMQDYVFVRLGDLLSLTFCTGWLDEQAYDRWRIQLGAGNRLSVAPAEFDEPEFAIEVDAVQVPDTPFSSAEALHAVLGTAPRIALSGRVAGRGQAGLA